ncbi:MAG: glycosyltransferase family 2 protein [Defluviitaleaceae bacterium]|nr:glycosyltransferase family 2 protein [Defluviitaleaceae bacterium]MCL2263547.1 glycosyltransferase family 2 protein [Defluviitaleaceae bacterium]
MLSILMATYNGEKYLAQQLDSLFSQTVTDFVLHVQDDASTDGTWDILVSYKKRYSEKISLIKRDGNSGDSKHNFIELMAMVHDDYLMLCDQDDVWLPNKIELTLNKMKELERDNPANTPLLVHTDLKVVDENLQIISPSYREATVRKYGRTALNQVLTLNNVTGCTAMYNRAMAELLTQPPKFCVVHDWWLQVVAACFGKIGHIYEPTLLYRQHGKNVIGAKDVRTLSYKIQQLRNTSHIKNRIASTYPQAQSVLDIYRNRLSAPQIELLERFTAMPRVGKFARWHTICKYKFFMDGFSRNIAYFLFV